MNITATQLRRACRRAKARRGFTLVELSIAVIIIGILLSFVVPSFVRVSEQNRVDAASQYLRSIWSAERIYWLENKTFTSSLSDLQALGLIDVKIGAGNDGYFNYSISGASASTFSVNATRAGSSIWTGTLHVSEVGDVGGFVGNTSGTVLTPPDI
jgi:prepilin-type N-terminal cleavage/methylation domain-containing protein